MHKETRHDQNFKHNFKKERVLRDFLYHNLPERIRDMLNLEALKVIDPNFIYATYRTERRADILCELKNKKGAKAYTLIQLEGQSSPDRYMAARVWEYHAAIGAAHLREGHPKIPMILTFVLYHGKTKWKGARSVSELFDNFNLYVEFGLKQPFLLHLGEQSIETLKKQGAAAGPQLIMKGQARGDYGTMLQELYPILKAYEQVDEQNMNYMMTHEKKGPQDFIRKVSKFAPEIAIKYKTMFEKEIRQAIQKGKQQGIQQAIKSLCEQGMITHAQAQSTMKILA